MIRIFVGYDPKETVVYHVCVNSIIRLSSSPVCITPLALNNLSNYVERHSDGSNQFVYSRFLIPSLMRYAGWALYIDGDMLLRTDITELWNLQDLNKALMVVKHDYKTRMVTKYLGAKNENYPRKNWSSVMLWNCNHPSNRLVTPEYVADSTGAQLHRLGWVEDELIGTLPIEWNWLPDEFGPNPKAKLVHYTLGAPCFHEFATTPMADEWHREKMLVNHCRQRDPE